MGSLSFCSSGNCHVDILFASSQIEMAQKLLNSDLAELITKMKLAQQYVMTRWVQVLLTVMISNLCYRCGDITVFFVCVFWAVYKRTTRNTCWWQRMRSQSMPRTCWMSSTNHDSRWSGFNQVRGKAKSFCCCGNGECSSSEQVTKRRELLDGCQWRTDEKMNWWTADTADANNQLPLLPQTFVMSWSILCCFVLLLHYLHLYPEKHSSSPLHLSSKMSF